VNRRALLRIAPVPLVPLVGPAAACAPGPPLASWPVSGRGRRPSAPPTPPAPQGAPVEPASPPPPDQASGWAREWEDLVGAARQEGTLSLLTVVGRGYRAVVDQFEQTFPGIVVEHLAESSAAAWLARARQGRQATHAAFDLALGIQPDRAIADGTAEGLWAPLKPLLFRPDVLDDAAWRDGFDARFLDTAGTRCLAWSYQVFHAYAVNTDLVPEAAIRSVRDLLDPRWRGKILSTDPRLGMGLLSAASVATRWGPGLLEQLLVDQRPVFVDGAPDAVAEPLARGRYPIALGVRPKALDPLRARGAGHQVRYLDLPDADFVAASPLLYFDRAAHPATAKLFANWVLTREAQSLLASSLPTNSARTDVAPASLDETGATGNTYFEPDREENHERTADTQRLVRALLSRAPR
jgi:iron(III) transport system substrate-binding protein